MSDLLGLGASAVSAYRTALSTIGENVANSETKGFARRSVQLSEAQPVTSSNIIYQDSLQFGGVRATAINRAWDQFRATDARLTSAAAGRTDTRQTWLTSVESALDDGAAGVGSTLGDFFNAGTSLASNPGDTLGRRSMLIALDQATGAFRTTADSLARVSQGITDSARSEVTSLNQDMAALAKVNADLRNSGPGTPTNASLQDERDRLLDSIAGRVDIDVSIDKQGLATVTLSGSSTSQLVSGIRANAVSVAVAGDGRLSLQLIDGVDTTAMPVSSGSLAGLVDVAGVTADRRAELDAIAQDFATRVNAWSAQGRTAGNVPGGALLDGSGGAASIKLLTSDPTAIAAASADGTANGNLTALADLRGSSGAESRWAGLVAGHALLLNSAKSEATAAATRRDNSFAARDEVTGIDLDQEAAELMRYQQAYNGATKIIQVARETMQSILDLF